MVQTIEAVFDGTVLRPQTPLTLAVNARVLVTVESLPTPAPAASFLQTARQLELDGPVDWSTNFDEMVTESEPKPEPR